MRRCLLATTQSDSHTWNLVYMQLLLEENGLQVINLSNCTPALAICAAVLRVGPDLIVVSTVNGHGGAEGLELLDNLHENLRDRLPPVVIGGRLTISEAADVDMAKELRSAGFDAVFVGPEAIDQFRGYLGEGAEAEFFVA